MSIIKTETHYVSDNAGIPDEMKCLSKWFTGLHTHYDLSAWCFYGYVGSENNKTAISLMLQYKNGCYWSAFGIFRPGVSAKWSFAGSKNDLIKLKIDEPTDDGPWSANGDVIWPGPGRVRIALISGAFGMPGTVYRLTADVCSYSDIFNPSGSDKHPDIFVDITIKDVIGAVPVGYGPASFLPNWLTEEQEIELKNYDGSTWKYLSEKKPQMINQGSYYYSSPVLQVENYTIFDWAAGQPDVQHESGDCGFLWMDSVIQTFGELNHLPKGSTVNWYWFAIPQLTKNQSLAVTSLWYTNNPEMKGFRSASLYRNTAAGSLANPNIEEEFWNIDDIKITCINQKQEYKLNLSGAPFSIDLTLKAVEGDQQLGSAIEGLFKVTGTVDSESVGDNCYAWGELSLPSTQTRMASKWEHLVELIKK